MLKKLFEKHTRIPFQRISRQFEKVEKDLENMKIWANHFHNKQRESSISIDLKEKASRREIEDIKKWIEHGERRAEHQKKLTKSLIEYLKEIHKHQVEIKNQVEEIRTRKDEEGQLTRIKRTIKRTEKDFETREDSLKEDNTLKKENIGQKELTQGQKQLLRILFQSPTPMGYKEIARAVIKKEKSVRNMVYELREKGFEIKDKPIGFRKKGFYIDKEEKIRISGR